MHFIDGKHFLQEKALNVGYFAIISWRIYTIDDIRDFSGKFYDEMRMCVKMCALIDECVFLCTNYVNTYSMWW